MNKSNTKMKNDYIHRLKFVKVNNGKRTVNEEGIYNGPRGLTMKHYCNDGDNVEKMVVVKRNGKYVIKTIKNGIKEECEYNDEELVNLLRANSRYKFIVDFLRSDNKQNCENKQKKNDIKKIDSGNKDNKHKKNKDKYNKHKKNKDKYNKDKKVEKCGRQKNQKQKLEKISHDSYFIDNTGKHYDLHNGSTDESHELKRKLYKKKYKF